MISKFITLVPNPTVVPTTIAVQAGPSATSSSYMPPPPYISPPSMPPLS